MSVVRNAEAAARRVANTSARKSTSKGSVSVVNHSTEKSTEEFLRRFPIELRLKVLTQATRAAAGVVRNEARRRAPIDRSRGRETRKERKQRGEQFNLRESITVKVNVYDTTVLAMTGPRRPWGNHANLIEYGHALHLWGSEDPYMQMPPKPFLRPAMDSTIREQEKRLIEKVKQLWERV